MPPGNTCSQPSESSGAMRGRKFLLESKLQFMANIVLARAANYEIIFRLAGPHGRQPAHLSTKLENFQPQVWWPAPLNSEACVLAVRKEPKSSRIPGLTHAKLTDSAMSVWSVVTENFTPSLDHLAQCSKQSWKEF